MREQNYYLLLSAVTVAAVAIAYIGIHGCERDDAPRESPLQQLDHRPIVESDPYVQTLISLATAYCEGQEGTGSMPCFEQSMSCLTLLGRCPDEDVECVLQARDEFMSCVEEK